MPYKTLKALLSLLTAFKSDDPRDQIFLQAGLAENRGAVYGGTHNKDSPS